MSDQHQIISAADVVREARTWIGTPFRHQGRAKGRRVDCGGVILGVMAAVGYSDFKFEKYGEKPDGRLMRSMCDRLLDRVDDIKAGDMVLIRWRDNPQHLGWLGDAGSGPSGLSLIHADPGPRVVHEVAFDGFWRDLLVQGYRLRGISS